MPLRTLIAAACLVALAGCQSSPVPPIRIVESVDLKRFMGDWYVIANIPTFIEKGAHNAVERYELAPDGTIATTFLFRHGSFDGEPKAYHPRGFVLDRQSNAVWGMQFVWPIKADYRIVYLSPDYDLTIVGRQRRDYAWIMARTPEISATQYQAMLEILSAEGYDVAKVERVPQQWPATRPPGQ